MKIYKLAFLVILASVFSTIKPAKTLDLDCSDYEFIFARGSGQTLNDVDFEAYKEQINAKLTNQNIKYNFYELGTRDNGYPAFSPNNIASLLGTYVSAGESYKFGESADKGVQELISYLKDDMKKCKNKKYILSGYSQGAFVINQALPYISSEKILYVATFGDPKLYLPEGKNKTACKETGLSNYRIYVPDCEVEEGIFDGMVPYESHNYKNKRGAWCNQNDFICGSKINITNLWKGHVTYNNDNGYKKFAEIIYEKILNNNSSSKETVARYSDSKKRDIVVVYDFSRKPFSERLKKRLVDLTNHGTRVSIYNLYTFANSTKILEEMIPFTNDGLEEKINQMDFKNHINIGNLNGGGNNLFFAVKELSKKAKWDTGSERNIFLYTDKVYSSYVSSDGTTIKEAIENAKTNDVRVSLLSEYKIEENINYRNLLSETGGEVIGDQYQKIALNKNYIKNKNQYTLKSYELNLNSKYTLVIINNTVYGISDKKRIVITNLDRNRINTISFIEYDEGGKRVNKRNFSFGEVKTPDSGRLDF